MLVILYFFPYKQKIVKNVNHIRPKHTVTITDSSTVSYHYVTKPRKLNPLNNYYNFIQSFKILDSDQNIKLQQGIIYSAESENYLKEIDSNILVNARLWQNVLQAESLDSTKQLLEFVGDMERLDNKIKLLKEQSEINHNWSSLTKEIAACYDAKYTLATYNIQDLLMRSNKKERNALMNSAYDLSISNLPGNANFLSNNLEEFRNGNWENKVILNESTTEVSFHKYLNSALLDLKGKDMFRIRNSYNEKKVLRIIPCANDVKYREKGMNPNHTTYTPELDSLFKDLQISDFDSLFVFDIFTDTCTHGSKVYDVIKQVLTDFHLSDQILHKIVKVPVNYFQNQHFGDSVMNAYNEEVKNSDAADNGSVQFAQRPSDSTLRANADSLTATWVDYLNAIYFLELEKSPAIITNSYTINCSKEVYKPLGLNPNGISYTNLLTSATNESEDEERYDEYSTPYGNSFLEPIYSFVSARDKRGTVVVGDQVSDKEFRGMYSKDGTRINVLGKGTAWGEDSCTKCIQKSDTGTSFATPEVAAKLFVAKALWKKNNVPITAIEARKRLILATDLCTPFIEKFSSSGSINMKKLVINNNGYLIDKNDSVIKVNKMENGILFSNDNGNTFYKFYVNKPTEKDEPTITTIRGIYYKDSRWFVFVNSLEKWIEIKNPRFLLISWDGKGKSDISLDSFKEKYKQFVILNN